MGRKRILVTGATGKQGGEVIKALSSHSAFGPVEILAVSRDQNSDSAKSLRKRGITIVEGNPALDAVAIFQAAGTVDGVFLVTIPKPAPGKDEDQQAYRFIDAAIKAKVRHFIFTSVDRGGPASSHNPTPVPHFASKHRIEKYLVQQVEANGHNMMWSILRPTGFFENLSDDLYGKGFASMWRQNGDVSLQLVACKDIGRYAAEAFSHPETYGGLAISLAGDELSYPGAAAKFKKTLGRAMPVSPGLVGKMLKRFMPDLGIMFSWMATDGFRVDIAVLRKKDPSMMDFQTWLVEESQFRK